MHALLMIDFADLHRFVVARHALLMIDFEDMLLATSKPACR